MGKSEMQIQQAKIIILTSEMYVEMLKESAKEGGSKSKLSSIVNMILAQQEIIRRQVELLKRHGEEKPNVPLLIGAASLQVNQWLGSKEDFEEYLKQLEECNQ